MPSRCLRLRVAVVSALCLVAVLPSGAYAYLDAGTGSFIIQVVAGMALGALFVVKMFWQRLKSFFGGLFGKRKPADDSQG